MVVLENQQGEDIAVALELETELTNQGPVWLLPRRENAAPFEDQKRITRQNTVLLLLEQTKHYTEFKIKISWRKYLFKLLFLT